jgi:hypothetical protein
MQSISDALKPWTDLRGEQPKEPRPGDESSTPKPDIRLIERLFAKFAAMYGTKFADHWEGADFAEVKSTWAEALAGVGREEIVAGIRGLVASGKPFPPTLPEFYALCRPRVDVPPVNDHAALDQMAARLGVSTASCDSYYQLRQRILERIANRRAMPALAP